MFQPSIFRRSVAGSLAQLEELVIEDCYELSSLIADESLKEEMVDADHQNNYDWLFPKLETLKINGCEKLQVVSPLLLAGDLPLLRDLSIKYCGKLRYIFDEYQHEGQLLHQLTLLPSLTNIDLYWVPSLINIFQKCTPSIVKDDSKQKHAKTRATDTNIAVSKAKMQQSAISLGSPASREGINKIIFTAECLLRPPLGFQNLRQMKLWEFSNIMSLFSVPIAATMMLEKLEISYCEELKHIITNGGEDYGHRNYSSIFPKLQQVDIYNCNKLEYVFPSTFSGGFQKLKYLTIHGACELKYVFGKYNHEEYYLSNDEFYIDLLALKTLSLEDVPNMISICFNKYHLKFPSLQNYDAPKITKMHMQNMTSEGANKSEIEEIEVERPGFKYGLNFRNLLQITIAGSQRLKAVFSTSTWRSLQQLSKLYIWECDELCNVIEDDDPVNHGHINYSSIFPKLEDLEIRRCMNLEFIFPSPVSGGLPKLKHLAVTEAAKLKYIFANESDEVQVDLSALETLSLTQVPNLINICATKHNILKLPSLRKIALDNCQELSARPFADLTLYWKPAAAKDFMRVIMHQQRLTSLTVEESIIEEVFSFEEYGEVEEAVTLNLKFMRLIYLRELRCICRGRKDILSLQYLSELEIKSCAKLRVVFSASMSKSLPKLSDLRIKDCPELVHLIEEDDADDDHLHQLCFPKLQYIGIESCDSLKSLFSISTFGMLPKLWRLEITNASELEQVFTCKQDDIQKMEAKDVFPTLLRLILIRLPCLLTVCGRDNFQTVRHVEMADCPRYEGNKAVVEELPSAQEMPHMGETSASPNFAESSKEAMETSVEEVTTSKISLETTKETLMNVEAKGSVPPSEKQAIKALPADSQLRTPSIHKLEDEQTVSEATVQLQHQDRGNEMKQLEHSVIESIGDKETEKEVGKVDPAFELTTSPKVSNMKETEEQGFQEHDGSKEAIITRKQSGVPLDGSLGSEFAQVPSLEETLLSKKSMEKQQEQGFQEYDTSKDAIQSIDDSVPSNIAEVGQGIKETMKQGLQENYALEEATRVIQPASSDLTKQSTEPFLKLSEKDLAKSTKEVSKKTVEEVTATETPPMSTPFELEFKRSPSVKATRVNLFDDVISSPHRQSQIGIASPSSSSILEIGEILELVELKDDERALLVKALELYPQLRLSRRSHPITGFSYRVLIDILIMLSTKTPYTMTEADKSTLEANLGAANYFGFDKDWVESVRTKVFDIDMVDVLATREKILMMEAELEVHDSALKHMRKERAETKERLAMARRRLEMAQSEFEAIDSQLLGLLEGCNKLMKMAEPREISAKDGPFGI